MKKYELVVIVDAAATQEEKDAIVKEVQDLIVKCNGKVINSQVWLDKHKFTFRMKKRTEGTYYLVNFEIPPSEMAGLRQTLRLNERVLRFLIIAL